MKFPCLSKLQSKWQSFDQKGIASVEFVLIVPVIITMYFGLATLSQAMMITRKLNLIARSTADLVSQQPANTTLNDATLNQIKNAAYAILYPYDSSQLELMVGEVIVFNSGGTLYARPEFSLSISDRSSIHRTGCTVLYAQGNGGGFVLGFFPASLFIQGAWIES